MLKQNYTAAPIQYVDTYYPEGVPRYNQPACDAIKFVNPHASDTPTLLREVRVKNKRVVESYAIKAGHPVLEKATFYKDQVPVVRVIFGKDGSAVTERTTLCHPAHNGIEFPCHGTVLHGMQRLAAFGLREEHYYNNIKIPARLAALTEKFSRSIGLMTDMQKAVASLPAVCIEKACKP